MGVDRQKPGKVGMKSTRKRQKTSGMDDVESVAGELLREDYFKITAKDPALPDRQFPKPYEKFKLQLFPVDDATRIVLLEHNHNPYLELTLPPRKKISSVVKHLNAKWPVPEKSPCELVLLPYEAQSKMITDCEKWTSKDSDTSAADVFLAVGQPDVFRLRYCWVPDAQTETFASSPASLHLEHKMQPQENEEMIMTGEEVNDPCSPGFADANGLVSSGLSQPLPTDGSVKAVQNLGVGSGSLLSWMDCMTNVSMSQLLSERTDSSSIADPLNLQQKSGGKQLFMNCDSFDAAIADLIARNQGSRHPPHVLQSSIWEAEETRHAFPVQEASSRKDGILAPSGRSPLQVNAPEGPVLDLSVNDLKPELQDECQATANPGLGIRLLSQNDASNLGLSNISWGDSLGPFEFGVSSKHVGEGDSIGLGGMITNSSDTFQDR